MVSSRRYDLPEPDEAGTLIVTLTVNGIPLVRKINNPGFRTALEDADQIGKELAVNTP